MHLHGIGLSLAQGQLSLYQVKWQDDYNFHPQLWPI